MGPLRGGPHPGQGPSRGRHRARRRRRRRPRGAHALEQGPRRRRALAPARRGRLGRRAPTELGAGRPAAGHQARRRTPGGRGPRPRDVPRRGGARRGPRAAHTGPGARHDPGRATGDPTGRRLPGQRRTARGDRLLPGQAGRTSALLAVRRHPLAPQAQGGLGPDDGLAGRPVRPGAPSTTSAPTSERWCPPERLRPSCSPRSAAGSRCCSLRRTSSRAPGASSRSSRRWSGRCAVVTSQSADPSGSTCARRCSRNSRSAPSDTSASASR